GPLLVLLQAEPLLGAGDLVAVDGVDQPLERRGQLADLGADDLQLRLAGGSSLLGGLPPADGGRQRVLDALQGRPGAPVDGPGDPGLLLAVRAAPGRAGAFLALAAGAAFEGVGASGDGL